jgi:TRAP-type transport system periplasmic protein
MRAWFANATRVRPRTLGAGLAAAALVAGTAAAQETTLRLGHDQVTAHTYHATTQYFAERVAELTDGRIQVSIFPGGTLGTETSMLSEVIDGNIDLSVSTTANASSFVPEFGILSVSYLFAGAEHFRRALADETFNQLIDEMIEDGDPGFRRVATMTPGARSVYSNVGPIADLDDLEGVKMRVMASPVESQVWGALGTLPLAIPFGDVYTGMQTGLIQAAENSPGSYVLNNHYEVAPYYSVTEHQWPISLIFIGNRTWERLSEEDREAILQAGRDTAEFSVEDAIASDQKLLDEMASEYGVQVNAVDTAPFVEALRPLQDEVAEQLGTQEIVARIRELQ